MGLEKGVERSSGILHVQAVGKQNSSTLPVAKHTGGVRITHKYKVQSGRIHLRWFPFPVDQSNIPNKSPSRWHPFHWCSFSFVRPP